MLKCTNLGDVASRPHALLRCGGWPCYQYKNKKLKTSYSSGSTAFRHVLERYGCSKNVPKKSFSNISPMHILSKNSRKKSTNISEAKIFSRDVNLLPQRYQILNILYSQIPQWGGFMYCKKTLTLKKRYAWKIFGGSCDEKNWFQTKWCFKKCPVFPLY